MKRRTFLSISTGSAAAILLQGCPKNGKVSDIVQAARSFATATVSLGVSAEIVDILTQDKTVNEAQGQVVFKATGRILRSLDRVRDSINAGVWDRRELDVLLDNALAEVAKLEADIGIKNPASAARFRQYIALLRFGIVSAAQIIKNLKPPAPPDGTILEQDSKRQPSASLTPDQLTQIINASTIAALKIVSVRTSNAETAWKLAADESKAIHEANKLRIK